MLSAAARENEPVPEGSLVRYTTLTGAPRARIHGAMVQAVIALFWTFLLWILAVSWARNWLLPAIASGLDRDVFAARALAIASLIVVAVMWFRYSRWAASMRAFHLEGYNRSMWEVERALSAYRRRSSSAAIGRGKLWAVLNFVLLALLIWLAADEQVHLSGLEPFALFYIGLMIVMAVNGTRLWFVRSSLLRYLAAALPGFLVKAFIVPAALILPPTLLLLVLLERLGIAIPQRPQTFSWEFLLQWSAMFVAVLTAFVMWQALLGRKIVEGLRFVGATPDSLAQPTAGSVMWDDPRQPIVLLRSFKDDPDLTHGDSTLESEIATATRRFGPFVAVGAPGRLPVAGAARNYYSGEAWRNVVDDWLDKARCVFLLPAVTQGLRWELDLAVAKGHLEKLILVFPGDRFRERWTALKDAIRSSQWGCALDQVHANGVLAVHFTKGGAVSVITSDKSGLIDIQNAVRVALYGVLLGDGAKPAVE